MGFLRSLFAAAFGSALLITGVWADIIAHYKFNESSGTNAADSVGSVNGTLQGSASFAPAGGIAGGAASLSTATDGVVNMGNNFQFPSGNFTISFWAKSTTIEADSILISKHTAGITNSYLFPIGTTGGGGAAGKGNFTVSSNVSNGVTSTTTINDGNWHQIVGTYTSGGNLSIYVDGAPAEETKTSSPMISSTTPFLVGGVGLNSGSPTVADGRYTGLIDDLQIYNTALNDANINFLFANPGAELPEPAVFGLISLAGFALRRNRRAN